MDENYSVYESSKWMTDKIVVVIERARIVVRLALAAEILWNPVGRSTVMQ